MLFAKTKWGSANFNLDKLETAARTTKLFLIDIADRDFKADEIGYLVDLESTALEEISQKDSGLDFDYASQI